MILSKDQFPVVVQAYDITGNKEIFIAEQVVANQSEVDTFVNRYAGKLIKARALTSAESNSGAAQTTHQKSSSRSSSSSSSSAGTIIIVILIILVILIAIGFYTGWIQNTFGISLWIRPSSFLLIE